MDTQVVEEVFPILHGQSTTGKKKQWSIKVIKYEDKAIIEIQHGYVGHKIQINQTIVTKGKNIGRSNETTFFQQAINDARTQWIKKKQSSYIDEQETNNNEDYLENSNVKNINNDVPNPMLAHEYSKHSSKLKFPICVQPKLDGTRCIAIKNNGLYSRNKKIYNNLEYIQEEVNSINTNNLCIPDSITNYNIILDGELYSHDITFQELIGIAKTELKENKSSTKINLYVYDIIIDLPYNERYLLLEDIFEKNNFQYLKLLKTDMIDSEDDIKEKHDEYIKQGYEGLMLRNIDAMYENKRSYNLQKYKEFFDKEYEIVNFTQGKGLESGCVIWICKTENNKQFSVRPQGTRDERKEIFKKGNEYIGKFLTIKYQNLTDQGIPRFPVGVSIRDYE